MGILLVTLSVLLLCALGAKFLSPIKSPQLYSLCTTKLAALSLALALVPTLQVLLKGHELVWNFSWQLFQGEMALKLDALSAFFLLPILLLSLAAIIFGENYLKAHSSPSSLGNKLFMQFILIFSMISVILASNVIFFILVWELMSLSSFFLVIHQAENDEARKAGWLYLSLTQIGTAFIIVFFLILADGSLTLNYADFPPIADPRTATLCFFLALIGFGTKAGMMPVHIWLPEAHPQAPSHISALMSGVMIKTGIYGIVRALTFLPTPQFSWALSLIIIGALTGIISVIFACAQKDLKRLLAYCSVKNIGIILMGLGLALLGFHRENPLLIILGLSGALLHVLNHALYKGLLFLGAGSVIHATHIQNMERLGGLGKKMPLTSITFLIGSLSICSLPPFNGFVSEFFIYMASFKALAAKDSWSNLPFILVIVSLALIGGLAVICFTKAYGVTFLGEAREKLKHEMKENSKAMTLPLITLSLACLFIGLFPFLAFELLRQPLILLTQGKVSLEALSSNLSPLTLIALMGFIFLALVSLIAFLRKNAVDKRSYHETGTWDCGYINPTPRIQYTGSSFIQMVSDHFDFFLYTKRIKPHIKKLFPPHDKLSTDVPDSLSEKLYKPLFNLIEKILARLTGLQHGVLNVYVLYIIVTLALLLLFKMD